MKNKKVLIILCLTLFISVVGCSEIKKEYYEKGKLKRETTFKNNKQEGPSKIYYESGALKSEFNYKNGKLEGPEIIYAKNGVISSIDTYKNGQKINKRSYDKKGKLEFDQDYPYIEEE